MKAVIHPGLLHGTVERVICSKSAGHRALICAAMAEGETLLEGLDWCEDLTATRKGLEAMGACFRPEGEAWRVIPGRTAGKVFLDCGESGSTLRFLLPLTAALGQEAELTGRGKLASRPLFPLDEQMMEHGAWLSERGVFPLRVSGRLRAGKYTLAGNVSSQFISGLLMALPLAEGDSRIVITGELQSGPYVDMTLGMMARFGVDVRREEGCFLIRGGRGYASPGQLRVEGDWSGAAFWLAAGALSPEGLRVRGLDLSSAQGDRRMLALLRAFGAETMAAGEEVVVRARPMHGVEIDAGDIPDLVPVLAVVAAAARGETRIRRIARLRLKESDRVASVLALLSALGVSARAGEDEMVIEGRGGFTGGEVDSFRDHRIAMAAAVAACAAEGPVVIREAQAVSKSYPGFFEQFRLLGGRVKEED